MKPTLILAVIAGGMTGVFVNVWFGVGLRGPAAPGSVFSVYLQTATDSYLGVTLAIIGSAAVSMVVASLLLRLGRTDAGADDLVAATTQLEALKGRKSSVADQLRPAVAPGPIRTIVFACDAGMGSSAMGASMLRRRIRAAGLGEVTVVNAAIAVVDDAADLVITQSQLTDRARLRAPGAIHISVDDFIDSPRYDEIVRMLVAGERGGVEIPGRARDDVAGIPDAEAVTDDGVGVAPDVLALELVRIHPGSATRDQALAEATDLLVAAGAVTPAYYLSMLDRESTVSTYLGHELAIPHGTMDAQGTVLGTAISFVRYDGGVDWGGRRVTFVVGIAGTGREHLDLLGRIAALFAKPAEVEKLRAATTPEALFALITGGDALSRR